MSLGGQPVGVGVPQGWGLCQSPAMGRVVGFPHHLHAANSRSPALSVCAAGLGIWEGWSLVPRAGVPVAATE